MTRRVNTKIPFRNRNHSGWCLASYIERFEYFDENKSNNARRCLAWENTVLIRARSREQAYRKAVALGRQSNGNAGWNSETKRRGAWRFEGLTELLPVYEELTDGAEILWKEHENRTVKTIKSLVKRKRDLSVFNDREDNAG
jgi:Domain of unknown function (DUF4288)